MKKYLLPILLLSISLSACTGKAKDATISKPSAVSYEESQQSFVESQKISLELSYGRRDGSYTGQVKNGLPHGEGTFSSSSKDGTKWTFRGTWADGHYNGYGFTVWETGQMEMGIYENDVIQKNGITLSEDGQIYKNTDESSRDTSIEAQTSDPITVMLVDSGWCSYKNSSYTHVPYAVQIKNPNSDYAIEFPTITITARDADGKILKTDEQVLNSISAGDTIFYGSEIFYEGYEPEAVEISVTNRDSNFEKQDNNIYVKQSDFTIFNISENSRTFKTFTGEITNNSIVNLDKVAVIIIYKNSGQIIGGDIGFVDDMAAGSTKAFEISVDSGMTQYDSYDFYAIQW